MKRAIIATYRVQSDDIGLMVNDGEASAAIALAIDEARAIHGALGLALQLADCRERPLKAIPGGEQE